MTFEVWQPVVAVIVPLVVLVLAVFLFRLFSDAPLQFKDAHILITGGSSGIGLAMAQRLLRDGARVTIVGRSASRLESARAALAAVGGAEGAEGRVRALACDCTDAGAVRAMVGAAEEAQGPVDVLVAAAGGASGGRFDEVSADALERGMRANYLSAALAAHAVFPGMVRRGAGHICFVGSLASLMGLFGYACYAPAKFAVRGLAEVLYYEGAHRGVGVTLVLPPDTDSPGYREELKVLPAETLAISQGSGVFPVERVASAAVDGLRRRRYRVTVGFDGAMLGMLTAGMTPGVTALEVICIPFLRIASIFYVADFKATIRKAYEKRVAKADPK